LWTEFLAAIGDLHHKIVSKVADTNKHGLSRIHFLPPTGHATTQKDEKPKWMLHNRKIVSTWI
jgi:hypothetical protein